MIFSFRFLLYLLKCVLLWLFQNRPQRIYRLADHNPIIHRCADFSSSTLTLLSHDYPYAFSTIAQDYIADIPFSKKVLTLQHLIHHPSDTKTSVFIDHLNINFSHWDSTELSHSFWDWSKWKVIIIKIVYLFIIY